jgi:hypothetical protein
LVDIWKERKNGLGIGTIGWQGVKPPPSSASREKTVQTIRGLMDNET